MQEITIPASVKSLNTNVFKGCTRLCVTIEGAPSFGTENFEDIASLIAPKLSVESFFSPKEKRAAVLSYLREPSLYTDPVIFAAYRKYAIGQRKKLLPEIFKDDTVAALYVYAEAKKITAANFDEEYWNPAEAANATACIAFLLDWKNKNVSPSAAEKLLEKELTKDPYNAADMKKLWTYEKLEDGTLTLTSYKGDETCVTVPPYIGKTPVTRLEEYVFSAYTRSGAQKTKKIFESIRKIESIVIGDNIKSIGDHAFLGCCGLQSITLPTGLTALGEGVFKFCNNLKEISLPGSLVSIGEYAFSGCSSLQSIALPDGVTHISEYAFSGCTRMESIEIPDSVTDIGEWAFYYSGLKGITLPSGLRSIGKNLFKSCFCLQSAVFGEGIEALGDLTFKDCDSLETVTFPESLKKFGKDAFDGCTALTEIRGISGSAAEKYAKRRALAFVALAKK